jgi:ABC-type branched-subunit amino acid transport system substrate-binding protein
MTDYTAYSRTATTAIAEGLQQAKDINLATLEVLQNLTSVLVPLSVSMLPKSEKLVPAIDTVVDRTFATIVKVVDAQYKLGATALDQLGAAAASASS